MIRRHKSGFKHHIDICVADFDSNKLLLIASNSAITHEFASCDYISDYYNTEPYLNVLYDDFEQSTKQSNKFIVNTTVPN